MASASAAGGITVDFKGGVSHGWRSMIRWKCVMNMKRIREEKRNETA